MWSKRSRNWERRGSQQRAVGVRPAHPAREEKSLQKRSPKRQIHALSPGIPLLYVHCDYVKMGGGSGQGAQKRAKAFPSFSILGKTEGLWHFNFK